jgi:hypothetical protein
VGPLSRYVSGFAWAVRSAFRTISLCRAGDMAESSWGSNGTGTRPTAALKSVP